MIIYIALFLFLVTIFIFEIASDNYLNAQPYVADIFYKDLGLRRKIIFRRVESIMLWVVICLIGFFRSEYMGKDANTYFIYYFNQVDYYTWKELLFNFKIDNGFFIIVKIVSLFSKSYWIQRGILFIISFSLYYYVFIRESPYLALSLIVFLGCTYLGLLFSILRQSLAGGIIFLGARDLKRKHIIRFLVLIAIASTIHKSALLLLITVPYYFLNKKINTPLIIIISFIFYFIFKAVFPIVASWYGAGRYIEDMTSGEGYYMMLFLIIIIIFTSFVYNNNVPYNRELNVLYNIATFSIIIQVGALQWALFTRLCAYVTINMGLLVPKLIKEIKTKDKLLFCLAYIVAYGFMFFLTIKGSPYSFHTL